MNSKLLFSFDWTDGNTSANDNIIAWLKENGFQFQHDHYFQLQGFIDNRWVHFEYEKNQSGTYDVHAIWKMD